MLHCQLSNHLYVPESRLQSLKLLHGSCIPTHSIFRCNAALPLMAQGPPELAVKTQGERSWLVWGVGINQKLDVMMDVQSEQLGWKQTNEQMDAPESGLHRSIQVRGIRQVAFKFSACSICQALIKHSCGQEQRQQLKLHLDLRQRNHKLISTID